jgi:hypothetical protein
MRKKVSTLLDEALYRRAKIESALREKQVSEVLGEALEYYLNEKGRTPGGVGAVDRSWGALPIAPAKLRRIMEEDDWLDS